MIGPPPALTPVFRFIATSFRRVLTEECSVCGTRMSKRKQLILKFARIVPTGALSVYVPLCYQQSWIKLPNLDCGCGNGSRAVPNTEHQG